MKTSPIVPARVDFTDAAAPQAPEFGDVYHARAGAFAQARHVFLGGNALPARWQGRERFVILETGFGLGNNFLATWQAWREDARRCERLVFISIEKHPLRREDLHRAHAASSAPELAAQLLRQWPALTPNLHLLDFEAGRVRLLLALGDARDWLPELQARVDAFYLDGFAPALNPEIWDAAPLKQLGRLAAPGATAATWSVARGVRDALAGAGFEVEKAPGFAAKGQMSVARYRPPHKPAGPAGREPLAGDGERSALIIGAGIAGAACARALARQGWQSTVLEALPGVGQAGSGNPGGLFHGSFHPQDGLHARFSRAAALATERELRQLDEPLPWLQWGLLRLEREPEPLERMRAQLLASGLPPEYLQVLSPEEARAHAGLRVDAPAWYYPGGGALRPAALAQAWLRQAGATLLTERPVQSLKPEGGRWQLLDADGRPLAEAATVILAAGQRNAALAAPWMAGGELPWVAQRGQLSLLAADAAAWLPRPACPMAGQGYALAGPSGELFFGATAQAHDLDAAAREADHRENLQRLLRLLALQPAPDAVAMEAALLPKLGARVGWRSLVPDRLPLVGGLAAAVPRLRAEQPRFWPRQRGLLLCGGLASRGVTWALLAGELAAAQLSGAPLPLEASLVDALDPCRFAARATRHASAS